MKESSLRFVIALLTLVIGGAVEELLPKCLGVGVPVLLSAVPLFAVRPPVALPVLFALAAGGVEDALSGLPFLTSASFFLVLTAFSHWSRLPGVAAFVAFPAYQIWLCLWCSGLSGSIYGRCLLALPIGVVTFAVVAAALLALERKAGVDEAG